VFSFTAQTLHCTALTLLRRTNKNSPSIMLSRGNRRWNPTYKSLVLLIEVSSLTQGFVLLSLSLLQEFASASTFNSCRNVLFLLASLRSIVAHLSWNLRFSCLQFAIRVELSL
jgi:hypothetical protein